MEQKNYFGAMLDMSRNAVMTVENVKKYIDNLSKMGYNALLLYTEDTYEVQNEPFFGYMRGRYSASEIKEMDAYALSKGIELIPCIQTLAHLNAIFRWPEYCNKIRDCGDILLCGAQRTYELIENMFKTLAQNYTSRRVNIGMDEAWMLGYGEYRKQNGVKSQAEIMKEHLAKVVEICKKYGFKPMMWSDMFFVMDSGGGYRKKGVKIQEQTKELVPKEISLVYWDYYTTDRYMYESMIKSHKQFNNEVWFAGGAWAWQGFAPYNKFSIKTSKLAMRACRKLGVKKVFLTIWGDDGRECSPNAVLPALFYAKQVYDGNENLRDIKAKFKEIIGEDFDALVALDILNEVNGIKGETIDPCKYMFYGDPFFNAYDHIVKGGEGEQYKKYYKRLKKYAKQSANYSYIFESEALLARVLSVKYELGAKTRKLYQAGDKEGLKAIIPEYEKAIRYTKDFYKAYKDLWFTENKANGFDVIEIRIGGLLLRLESCKQRLLDFINGKITEIPELNEKLLEFYQTWDKKGMPINRNRWQEDITPSVL